MAAVPPSSDPPQLLTIRDVCAWTTLTHTTIYRAIANGAFPRPVRLPEGRVAWRAADVARWIESRLIKR
jgi:prophage regulatory protein